MLSNFSDPQPREQNLHWRARLPLLLIAGFSAAATLLLLAQPSAQTGAATPAGKAVETTNEIAAPRAEIERLKGLVPDQAHAMEDVGYHFANLWFAGQKQNWPLATFYLAETRSHLRWAVRIIPVRKTSSGLEVDLKGILDAVDNTPGVMLSAIKTAIEQKDLVAFTNAYRQTIEGCYACHKASEKPFIRPQIPAQPPEHIINMDPNAKWPE